MAEWAARRAATLGASLVVRCVLTGYEDAAHEHGTRARRANDASGRGHTQRSSTKPAPARPA
eukprot:6816134-Prymnesium_polylepis.1